MLLLKNVVNEMFVFEINFDQYQLIENKHMIEVDLVIHLEIVYLIQKSIVCFKFAC